MDNREQMLANAKQAIERVAVARADYAGPCHQCIHFKSGAIKEYCRHPIVQTVSLMEDQGYNRTRFTTTDYQRSSKRQVCQEAPLCGPNGLLFETYSNDENMPRLSFWEKVQNFFRNRNSL